MKFASSQIRARSSFLLSAKGMHADTKPEWTNPLPPPKDRDCYAYGNQYYMTATCHTYIYHETKRINTNNIVPSHRANKKKKIQNNLMMIMHACEKIRDTITDRKDEVTLDCLTCLI